MKRLYDADCAMLANRVVKTFEPWKVLISMMSKPMLLGMVGDDRIREGVHTDAKVLDFSKEEANLLADFAMANKPRILDALLKGLKSDDVSDLTRLFEEALNE